jgi:c-di-GMP-binding flagellar brake protein YcgR
MESERRRHPRFPLIADTEITEIVSGTKLSAKTSDLSAGGCFLDMINPSPEDTEIVVRIFHADATFTARGKVVFVFPNMGMGVMFTDVPASQQAILQKWLAELGSPG